VYIYEPHLPTEEQIESEYWLVKEMHNIYAENGFNVMKLPNYILKQTNLSLCYMYALHFFMIIFITKNKEYPDLVTKYQSIDNIYIMNFVRYILKLCNAHGLIPDIDYYILTNNNYQIQKIINKDLVINDLLLKVSDISTLKLIFSKTTNIKLNIAGFIYLYLSKDVEIEMLEKIIFSIPNELNPMACEMEIIMNILNKSYEPFELCNNYNLIIDEKYYTERTALMLSIFFDNAEITKLLLKKKEKIEGPELLYAIYNVKQIDLLKLLLEKKLDIDFLDNLKNTPLILAVNTNNQDIVKLILEKNPNIDLRNNYGITALFGAIYLNNPEIVKLILEKKPNLNFQYENGITVLMKSILDNKQEIAKLLLEKEQNIDLQNEFGFTSLMTAVYLNNLEIVKLILEKNPNINIKGEGGNTALMVAIMNDNPDIVKLLLQKNNDLNLRNDDNYTVFDLAKNNKEMTDVLYKRNKN